MTPDHTKHVVWPHPDRNKCLSYIITRFENEIMINGIHGFFLNAMVFQFEILRCTSTLSHVSNKVNIPLLQGPFQFSSALVQFLSFLFMNLFWSHCVLLYTCWLKISFALSPGHLSSRSKSILNFTCCSVVVTSILPFCGISKFN